MCIFLFISISFQSLPSYFPGCVFLFKCVPVRSCPSFFSSCTTLSPYQLFPSPPFCPRSCFICRYTSKFFLPVFTYTFILFLGLFAFFFSCSLSLSLFQLSILSRAFCDSFLFLVSSFSFSSRWHVAHAHSHWCVVGLVTCGHLFPRTPAHKRTRPLGCLLSLWRVTLSCTSQWCVLLSFNPLSNHLYFPARLFAKLFEEIDSCALALVDFPLSSSLIVYVAGRENACVGARNSQSKSSANPS